MYLGKSNICSRRSDVCSMESDVVSLDAGCAWMGCPALDLWDVVREVLPSSKNTYQAVRDHCRKEEVADQVPKSRARSDNQSTKTNTKKTR